MTRNRKKLTAGTQIFFLLKKIAIYLYLGLYKGRPSTEEAFSKENIHHFKHEISYFFLFLWVIYALLDPDPLA
jgi:hypothetical protein